MAEEAVSQGSDGADGSAATGEAIASAPDAPRSMSDAMATQSPTRQRRMRLAKLAGVHFAFWLATMGLFAAADSWHMLSNLALAGFLAIVAGIAVGVVTANLVHEWAHYVGARRSGGTYSIPHKISLFVYDWKFDENTVSQFLTMSKAGTLGGVTAVLLVWFLLPMDTLARAGVLAGTLGAFAFAARIEWPVLKRVQAGGDPLKELSKIDEDVLKRSFGWALAVGLLTLLLVAP